MYVGIDTHIYTRKTARKLNDFRRVIHANPLSSLTYKKDCFARRKENTIQNTFSSYE